MRLQVKSTRTVTGRLFGLATLHQADGSIVS